MNQQLTISCGWVVTRLGDQWNQQLRSIECDEWSRWLDLCVIGWLQGLPTKSSDGIQNGFLDWRFSCGRVKWKHVEIRNKLHIYRRPCCTGILPCGPRYEPLSGAPFLLLSAWPKTSTPQWQMAIFLDEDFPNFFVSCVFTCPNSQRRPF